MKYRKRPVVIEAVQFTDTEESILELSELGLDPVRVDYADLDNPVLKIETLEGLMVATEGDYIIKGVQGEFYPCKPDIFKKNIRKSRGVRYVHLGFSINFIRLDYIFALILFAIIKLYEVISKVISTLSELNTERN